MAAMTLYQSVGTLQSCRNNGNSRLLSKVSRLMCGLLRRGSFCSRKRSTSLIQASAFQATVFDEASAPSSATTSDSHKKTSEAALVLIRHGESMWNEKNLFTGCVDVPLTTKGVEEAVKAGKRIRNIPVDMIFTSASIRAQMTAMLA
ncbi:hypothetical protein R3W88_025082 [Solanum pinnatisectum]|uniref:phosphoglycerate mutase (2,3-diphosphoglycerate-dependent) n=1 Tax=Solanum pinnatisectum TaxID=50273 RepID=A0AAV9M5E5_9SOLN|nr:hypothetical protein R3W88_025082 [Solanum pinnatisectum]